VRLAGGQVLTGALVCAIAAVTASVLIGPQGLSYLRSLYSERTELGRATFALLQTNARLREEIRRLRHDDLYLEQLARRQFGLVRPNETVYRFRRPAN
jgi:cell division protein FtsB